MSLCDQCMAPGACCKSFTLFGKDGVVTTWVGDGEAERQAADQGHPFVPVQSVGRWTVPEGEEHAGREYEQWRWGCTKLGEDGRCLIYEDRPQLCRDFEPASGSLCVHYCGAEGGDPTLGFELQYL